MPIIIAIEDEPERIETWLYTRIFFRFYSERNIFHSALISQDIARYVKNNGPSLFYNIPHSLREAYITLVLWFHVRRLQVTVTSPQLGVAVSKPYSETAFQGYFRRIPGQTGSWRWHFVVTSIF